MYSFRNSISQKTAKLFNEYISSEKKFNHESVNYLKFDELNDGEIIFSKNNVCIHVKEDLLASPNSSNSNLICNSHCILGYFSIKLCKLNLNESIFRNNLNLDIDYLKNKKSYCSMLFTWTPNLVFKNFKNQHLKVNLDEEKLNLNRNRISLKKSNTCENIYLENKFNKKKIYSLKKYKSDLNLNYNAENELNYAFLIDIRKISFLKLFFNHQICNLSENIDDGQNEDLNSKLNGRLVICSHDYKFKIFHFHNNGLFKFKLFLNEWKFIFCLEKKPLTNFNLLNSFEKFLDDIHLLTDNSFLEFNLNKFSYLKNLKKEYNNNDLDESQIFFYKINKNAFNYLDLHHFETNYKPLSISNSDEMKDYFSLDGRLIYDFKNLKIRVFFAGIQPSSRKYFWPYLLNRLSPNSTLKERIEIIKLGEILYKNIDKKRRNMNKEEKKDFYRKYQSIIEKDVPRTDRMNPAFSGRNNLKVKQMERILLNYAIYNKKIGYTQGMSDFLAPLVILIEPESEIFFNFVYLLEKKNFFCLPNDYSIDNCIATIRELLRLLDFKFYQYFIELSIESSELLFTHRWMLLCFKREFNEEIALRIWECCWTELKTNYFQYFVCVAIIQLYGNIVLDKKMNSDEILLYFCELSQKMDGYLVLRKATSLLYTFSSLPKIPCTLRSLIGTEYKNDYNNQAYPLIECLYSSANKDAKLLCLCNRN